jgi:hypothetical protein
VPLQRTPPGAKKAERSKIRSQNIKETVDSFEQKGTIGTSRPANKVAAIKQAVAISYAEERRGKRKRGKK